MEREPNDPVVRIQLKKSDTKRFPVGVDRISLETLDERVIRVRAVYDIDQTRKESLTALVKRLSQQYGEPRRIGMTYTWQDEHTLLKAFDEELRLPASKGVELRTAIEVADRDVVSSLSKRSGSSSGQWNFDKIYRRLIGGE